MSSWNIRESTILESSQYPLTNNINVFLIVFLIFFQGNFPCD